MAWMSDAPRNRGGRPRTRPLDGDNGAPVRALDRGLTILDVLADGAPKSLRDVAGAARLAPSTAHRLLETLSRRGFVDVDDHDGRYRVGPRAFVVGTAFVRGGLSEVAHEPMVALRDALGETVNLAVRDADHAVYVHQAEGNRAVRLFTRVGARVPLHASGVGKALLAWADDAERDAVLPHLTFAAHAPATFTDPVALRGDLRASVERGYALDLEEYEAGVRCAAAPVRDARGIVAAMSVSAPLPRFDDERLREAAAALIGSADEVSRRLGWVRG